MLYQDDIDQIRAIAKAEIAAAGADSNKKIKGLAAELKKVKQDSKDALAKAVRDLEAEIKKAAPVATKPAIVKKTGGK